MKRGDPIYVDANVLLEVLLDGRKNAHISRTVLSRASKVYISPLTVHLYVYFGKKEGHSVEDLLLDLAEFETTIMDTETIKWATLQRRSNDFEDALQIASALRSGCDEFITFDKGLADLYGNLPTLKVTLIG